MSDSHTPILGGTNDALFRSIVEAAPNAMVLAAQDGTIVLINRQAELLFGYTREQLVGLSLERLVPDRVRASHPGLRLSYFKHPQSRPMGSGRDLFGLRKDGTEVPIEIGLNPLETETGTYVLASIIDISERKRAEEAQQALNRNLAAQVEETRQALDRLRQAQYQLVQAEKMASLGGLVAGVAHEVNTPVGIGVTAASHLLEEAAAARKAFTDKTLTQSQFEACLKAFEQGSDIILRNLKRAADLISSFKQVAVDQSTHERRCVNLQSYIDEVLLSLRPKLKGTQHAVTVTCPKDINMETTPGALSQVLTNLFVNALTHAFDDEQAGTISIQVEREGGDIVMRVSDDGKGIPPGDLGKIFDPFFTTKRGAGGTGLGLNIVFNLVHQTLGGSIDVSSTPGAGTCFTIRLRDTGASPAA